VTKVVKSDITKAVKELGIQEGDIVLVHSSFKSLGEVDGGAETVISGFGDAIGKDGTLVLPTFVQKDFAKAYGTWHLDKKSDVGYLTNYFRKREGSLRSDQATHSVAAYGKYAQELTKTHGHTHKRFGNFGDTPFSADSPWEKMYQMNAKIVLLGVDALSITFRHYAEYVYMEECLNSIKEHPDYDKMKKMLWCFEKPGVWPHVNNMVMYDRMVEKGFATESFCSNAKFICIPAKEFVDATLKALRSFDEEILWRTEYWDTDAWINWTKDLREMQKERTKCK